MDLYIEDLPNELIDRIKQFLNDNKEEILDYKIWKISLNLFIEARNEIEKSVKGFGEEFDVIIKKYHDSVKSDISEKKEIELIYNTNKALKELYSRYIVNIQAQLLLNQLLSKKYR